MASSTTVLFDFFGTLVDYSPSRTEQGYHETYAVLRGLGVRLTYEQFLGSWVAVSEEHDRRSDRDHREYGMEDVARAFLTSAGAQDAAADDAAVRHVIESYLSEWSRPVRPVAGVAALLGRLAATHRLVVVTNTNEPDLVPALLDRMSVRDRFEAVITSVEVGYRKPHPAIYEAALQALGVCAAECVFVGDSVVPDYTGPLQAGMAAFLIDPGNRHNVPVEHRLRSVLDLADVLHDGRPSAATPQSD